MPLFCIFQCRHQEFHSSKDWEQLIPEVQPLPPAFPGNLWDKIWPIGSSCKSPFPSWFTNCLTKATPTPVFSSTIHFSHPSSGSYSHLALISFATFHDFTQHPEDSVQIHALSYSYSGIFPVLHDFF